MRLKTRSRRGPLTVVTYVFFEITDSIFPVFPERRVGSPVQTDRLSPKPNSKVQFDNCTNYSCIEEGWKAAVPGSRTAQTEHLAAQYSHRAFAPDGHPRCIRVT